MRYHILWLLIAMLLGCGPAPQSDSSPTTTQQPDRTTDTEPAAVATTVDTDPGQSDTLVSPAMLASSGKRLTQLENDQTLVCGADAESGCICLQPLPCTGSDCITLNENISAFRSALSSDNNGRTVNCQQAEVGRCGNYSYFYFRGDVERDELRWFDAEGQLVGQRDVTDYEAYCGKRTWARYQGQIPDCEHSEVTELICGSSSNPALNPLSDLDVFTAPKLQPTGDPL